MKLLSVGFLCIIALGCKADPKSGSGFSLPEGDVERGKLTFVQLQCNACHTVDGVEFESAPVSDAKLVALGGKKRFVVTYGDLVTSIINPSHRFAFGYQPEEIKQGEASKMRLYNDEMTVSQLADLVTFLQTHYQVKAENPTRYMPYH